MKKTIILVACGIGLGYGVGTLYNWRERAMLEKRADLEIRKCVSTLLKDRFGRPDFDMDAIEDQCVSAASRSR